MVYLLYVGLFSAPHTFFYYISLIPLSFLCIILYRILDADGKGAVTEKELQIGDGKKKSSKDVSIPPELISEWKEIFHKIDRSGGGKISKSEIVDAMRAHPQYVAKM